MANCSVCAISTLGHMIDDVIQCNGPCNALFHRTCVKLQKTSMAVILGSPNIRWLCDGCIQIVPQAITEKLDCMANTLSSLSTNLASTFSQLASCSDSMKSISSAVASENVGNSFKTQTYGSGL